jgi:hypothetical protein
MAARFNFSAQVIPDQERIVLAFVGNALHQLDWENVDGTILLPGDDPATDVHPFQAAGKKKPNNPFQTRPGHNMRVTYIDAFYDPNQSISAGKAGPYAASGTDKDEPPPFMEPGDGSITVIIGTGPGAITRRLPLKSTDIVA